MALASFLRSLLEDGRVRVDSDFKIEPDTSAADDVLAAWERESRCELPGNPPCLFLPAARWGACMMYRACQALVFRDLGAEALAAGFAPLCPEADASRTHYSVDLTFRFLPNLLKMAKAASESDPLVEQITRWAQQFPLSSVGIAGLGPLAVEPIATEPSLLAMYVDRILDAQDITRLDAARVRAAIRQAIGLHRHLAPKISAALEDMESSEVAI